MSLKLAAFGSVPKYCPQIRPLIGRHNRCVAAGATSNVNLDVASV